MATNRGHTGFHCCHSKTGAGLALGETDFDGLLADLPHRWVEWEMSYTEVPDADGNPYPLDESQASAFYEQMVAPTLERLFFRSITRDASDDI